MVGSCAERNSKTIMGREGMNVLEIAVGAFLGVLGADIALGFIVSMQAKRKRNQALDKVKDFERELYDKLMPHLQDNLKDEEEDSDEATSTKSEEVVAGSSVPRIDNSYL